MIPQRPLPPVCYAVYRLCDGGVWRPVSMLFPSAEQAHRYELSLPYKDWKVEVREVKV